jgi:hypothetical protein
MVRSASREGMLAYLIGAILALAVGGLGTVVGLDRDRAFYPTITVVVASYYVLFAVMDGSNHALLIEAAAATAFLAAAIAGFRKSLWVVVAALALHGVFDLLHGQVIANPGVPAWWPAFCLAFDGVAAAYLASLLVRQAGRVHAPPRLPHERNT